MRHALHSVPRDFDSVCWTLFGGCADDDDGAEDDDNEDGTTNEGVGDDKGDDEGRDKNNDWESVDNKEVEDEEKDGV